MKCESKMPLPAIWRDRLGIALSVLCLIHCLLTPFVIGFFPIGTALGLWQHGFHKIFLVIVPIAALLAFVPGWKRHGDHRVWYWGVGGIVLLSLGAAAGEYIGHDVLGPSALVELGLTLVGGACLIRAHLLNRALCVCC